MAISEPAVFTRGLTKTFRGRPAVDGLDLEVPRGGVFALLGPNGAGKTTTIKRRNILCLILLFKRKT